MGVLDAAISLDSVEHCAHQDRKLGTPYSLRDIYSSFCVLKNQEKVPVPVLS